MQPSHTTPLSRADTASDVVRRAPSQGQRHLSRSVSSTDRMQAHVNEATASSLETVTVNCACAREAVAMLAHPSALVKKKIYLFFATPKNPIKSRLSYSHSIVSANLFVRDFTDLNHCGIMRVPTSRPSQLLSDSRPVQSVVFMDFLLPSHHRLASDMGNAESISPSPSCRPRKTAVFSVMILPTSIPFRLFGIESFRDNVSLSANYRSSTLRFGSCRRGRTREKQPRGKMQVLNTGACAREQPEN